ncbi:glutaredoxin family protein [Cellvibrio sp. PSBB006]|jgi:glutaredoxin|uniref:glutaredoxin family protein n=1 Tax=Cellvibrio sp. PSBB006 TaxID=1987723 RepID=UPI000B3B11E0|nr:glutaredoxin family protein [Cellvibrio sp. PSBB006]ARU26675.1 hypothetical protein CBR65_04095 [Cellvibrio sp. PSBB006]
MNKVLIGFLVLLAVAFNWKKFTADAQTPANISMAHGQQVVLYATDWCGYCARTRKYFKDNNIPFTEYDIEKSSEGREQYDQLNGKGVPLLVVNGEVIRGYNPNAIQQAMKKIN